MHKIQMQNVSPKINSHNSFRVHYKITWYIRLRVTAVGERLMTVYMLRVLVIRGNEGCVHHTIRRHVLQRWRLEGRVSCSIVT